MALWLAVTIQVGSLTSCCSTTPPPDPIPLPTIRWTVPSAATLRQWKADGRWDLYLLELLRADAYTRALERDGWWAR